MKKSVVLGVVMFSLMLFSLSGVLAAAGCDIGVSMINQDPYLAIPGDYVKLVFQVDGMENPECGVVEFELLEQYPIIFDPDEVGKYTINAGSYDRDFSSFFVAQYKVRVDENALDGDNPIEVQYKHSLNLDYESITFDLNVEDARADFEVHVKDYDSVTNMITFEILNIADSDVEALTVEIPKQEAVVVKGAKTNIVGDLDSNEYTTANFEVVPARGYITLEITYSDTINKRRMVEKNVLFEPEYFEDRAGDQKSGNVWMVLFFLLVAILIISYVLKKRKKKKMAMKNKLGKK
ncbi:hypothetical protein HOD29_05945 [archaeon]|jgi:hypothetical protein|nr:hypothetical protein [archaeon]